MRAGGGRAIDGVALIDAALPRRPQMFGGDASKWNAPLRLVAMRRARYSQKRRLLIWLAGQDALKMRTYVGNHVLCALSPLRGACE